MSDLNFIDSYFKAALEPEQVREFEQKIREDPVFAEEVAFYCSSMALVADEVAAEKKKRFRELYEAGKTQASRSGRGAIIKRLWPYAAVAAVLAALIIGWYAYQQPASIDRLADQYIEKNFQPGMGVKMAAKEDSLDAAIRLYNENKLEEALERFEKIAQADPSADLPKKMAGIVSLRNADYDKAIAYFTALENLDLYSNPGKLYHALALIKRDQSGDKKTAKNLLKQVIDQDLEGKETAQKWLRLL